MNARRSLPSVPVILMATFLLVVGSSLQTTLISLRTTGEGFDAVVTGILMASFSVGYAGGSVLGVMLVRRVGMVRTLAALASVASIVPLLHGLIVVAPVWAALRFAYGICYSAMMLIVESWLNAEATSDIRGQVLAVYGTVFMVASGVGQGGIAVAPTSGLLLFCIVSIVLSCALVPTSLVRLTEPHVQAYRRVRTRELMEVSPFGTVGIAAAGLLSSAFWGLAPRYARAVGMSNARVALFLASAVMGAMAMQWPLGRASDRFDRRRVALVVLSASIASSVALSIEIGDVGILLLLSATFGASTLTLYSLSLAHLNDHVRHEHMVEVAAGAIFVFGAAAGSGPVLAGGAMSIFGARGLFLYTSSIAGAFLVFGAIQLRTRVPLRGVQKRVFEVVPRTTQIAARLLGRGHRVPPASDAAGEADATNDRRR